VKIRAGFVSNSSSTSFLIIAKSDLNRADFFELMGISPNSPVADLFSEFYESVEENISSTVDFKKVRGDVAPESLIETRRSHLSERMLEKIRDAKKRGFKAYYGWLDSETSPIQSFFCTDSFEVENEKMYFNGLECTW
jgi:hypothetical protein